jgi:truncated hemoglobin YjbI
MATKRPTTPDRAPRHAKKPSDEARFEAWLRDFDARMAELTARQEVLLRDLGVEPHKAAPVHEPA